MRPDTVGNLENIQEAAAFITEDIGNMTFEAFLGDRRARQLVVHNFLIIGEAVNRIRRHDPEIFSAISEADLIVDMRNARIHGYDVINYRAVWRSVHESLPVLLAEVQRVLSEANNNGE